MGWLAKKCPVVSNIPTQNVHPHHNNAINNIIAKNKAFEKLQLPM